MNVRRLALAAAVVLTVAVSVTFAQPPVTVVLTNGQQYSGTLTGISGSGNIAIDANGRQMSWAESNVALVEFTPGQPTPQELQQVSNVPSNRSFLHNLINARTVALVLQNGQMVTGTLSAISNDGNQLTLVTQNGQNNYFASDIARLYPNPSAAGNLQNLLASNQDNQNQSNQNQYYGYGQPVGTSGQLGQSRTIRVPANQPWTPTGINVRQGQRLVFQASGQISWTGKPEELTGPAGKQYDQQVSEQFPVPTAGVGALIARVGNSEPFVIGDFTQPLTMPASGQLFLGVNDNNYGDNTGSFSVQISQAGGQH